MVAKNVETKKKEDVVVKNANSVLDLNQVTFVTPNQTAVHHMVRRIGASPSADGGTISAEQANEQVSRWLLAGYKLHNTHPLGMENDGVNILYIFVKEDKINMG